MMYSISVAYVLMTLLALSAYSSVDVLLLSQTAISENVAIRPKAAPARRMIKQASRTSLVNLGPDELMAEETMFIEDTWITVFNEIGVAGGCTGTTDETVRLFVDDEVRNGKNPPTDRKLGGLTPRDWFHIGAS
jgi:hypothetical protein